MQAKNQGNGIPSGVELLEPRDPPSRAHRLFLLDIQMVCISTELRGLVCELSTEQINVSAKRGVSQESSLAHKRDSWGECLMSELPRRVSNSNTSSFKANL